MVKRLYALVFFVILFGSAAKTQSFTGLRSSPFGGVTNVDYNPAIADNRFFLDVNLIGLSASAANNYIGVDRKEFFKTIFSDSTVHTVNLYNKNGITNRRVSIDGQVQGPLSFMISFGDLNKKGLKNKNAIGFSYHLNSVTNILPVSSGFVQAAYYGAGGKTDSIATQLSDPANNSQAAIRTMTWMDWGLTYSRVIIDEDEHMLKLGGTLKLIQEVAGGNLYFNETPYSWQNLNISSLYKANVNYVFAQDALSTAGRTGSPIGNYMKAIFSNQHPLSAALDLGLVYEWRPDKDKYKYVMDCKDQWRIDQNRYKLAAGFSVVDIGAVRFKRGAGSGNFNADISNWSTLNTQFAGSLQALDDSLRAKYQIAQNNSGGFTMWLPTRFNMFLDYNIIYNVGLNLSGTLSPNMAKNGNMVTEPSIIALTPKYEFTWFGAYLPLSYDFRGNVDLGLTLRAGPLIIGTGDLLNFFAKKRLYAADFHVAIKVTIPYQKLKDTDHDGVSNGKDWCPHEKGNCATHGCADRDSDGVRDKDDWCPDVPGPKATHGCPDTDGDGIIDAEDSCPFDPGPAKYHGCPDRDGDGIPDKYDECPDVPGLARFNGCPDRDSDGVPDKLDICPDLPGPAIHHGCPDTDGDGVFDDEDQCVLTPGPKENHGCPWPDRDGDGIPDKDDLCPDVFGIPENHGCPALPKRDAEILRIAFESLEFQTAKDIISPRSYASLNNLATLLVKKPNYGLSIEGHTDNVGTDEHNLILSQKRADAVRNYLISKGINGNRLTALGYGASRPIADNDTPEGKQKNRRVEMHITFRQ